MAVTHTSRRGKVYYLHSKADKKGRLRYFFSTKPEGDLAETVPDGHEIYESVNAQVFLRMKARQVVTDEELATVLLVLGKRAKEQHVAEWHYKAEIKDDAIVIHEVCQDYDRLDEFTPFARSAGLLEFRKQLARYRPMMRFTLVDESTRFFHPERMCFRGEDHWISIGQAGPLVLVACKYIKYLGDDEFFELIY